MRARKHCRICGSVWPYPSHYWVTEGGGCKTCAGSPLCDTCGHPRKEHTAVFRKGGRACAFRTVDIQSLSHIDCACEGHVAVEARLSDARFAQPDSGPLPKLRPPRAERPA